MPDASFAGQQETFLNVSGLEQILLAIKKVFGEEAYNIPVRSTKSVMGHAMGGAGAIEAIFVARALQEGIIPPTINYETPDPECDLDYVPNVARPTDLKVAMSNSFGLGGQNACIVLGKYNETAAT